MKNSNIMIVSVVAGISLSALGLFCLFGGHQDIASGNERELSVREHMVSDPVSGKVDAQQVITSVDVHALSSDFARSIIEGDSNRLQSIRKELLRRGSESVASLETMLNCGDLKCELEALRLLVQISDDRGLTVALAKVLTVSDQQLSSYLEIFGECRDPATIYWLSAFLSRTDRVDVRERVARIIQSFNDPALISALAESAEATSNESQKKDALVNLAMAKSPMQVDTLIEVYSNTGLPEVQNAVVYALANIGTSDAVRFLASEALGAGEIATVCLDAIEGIKSVYAQEELLRLAYNSKTDAEVRAAAVLALSEQNSDRVKNALANLLGDDMQVVVSVTDSDTQTDDLATTVTTVEPVVKEERWF